jgi:metal-responsive CopG/Arc/MetJ family transcriptional regulator
LYVSGVKVETTITLSEEIVEAVDHIAGASGSRSEVIETALRRYLAQTRRDEQNRRDLEIINRRAARLNREVKDVLAFQGEW